MCFALDIHIAACRRVALSPPHGRRASPRPRASAPQRPPPNAECVFRIPESQHLPYPRIAASPPSESGIRNADCGIPTSVLYPISVSPCPRVALPPPPRPPAVHWITWSARMRMVWGNVIPRALAVFVLITSSNRIGCSTGRSAGLAPFRILSTKVAARRHRSGVLGP